MDYSELPELPPEQEEPLFASAQPTEPDRDDTDALFAVLNLDRDCTADDIKREYKRLAALLHPDRHPLAKEAADTHFQTLNHAYEGTVPTARQSVLIHPTSALRSQEAHHLRVSGRGGAQDDVGGREQVQDGR